MYVPPHFVEARAEVLHHLIEKNPLGILFTNGKSGLTRIIFPSSCMRAKVSRACFIRMSLVRALFVRISPPAMRF